MRSQALAIALALVAAPASQAAVTFNMDNVYTQDSNLGSLMEGFIFADTLDILNGGFPLIPLVSAGVGFFNKGDCDQMRAALTRLSTEEVQIEVGKCRDVRRLALNTLTHNYFGFTTQVTIKSETISADGYELRSLVNGPAQGEIRSNKKTKEAMSACVELTGALNKMNVTVEKAQKGSSKLKLSHLASFTASCSMSAEGAVTVQAKLVGISEFEGGKSRPSKKDSSK